MLNIESDLRLETLLVSFTIDNYDGLINDLIESGYMKETEIKIFDKYKYLVKSLNKVPNVELMKREFPELSFVDIEKIDESEINDYVQLFITKRINDENSYKIIKLSEKVKKEGLSKEVIEEIGSLSKSDNIKTEFEDITKTILEKYEDKELSLGFRTGVDTIDEETGGFHLGFVNTIMGYAGSGKTTWGVNIAYNAMQDGFNVFYLSLEVSKEHILYDLLSRHSNESQFTHPIEHKLIKQRKLEEKDEKYLWEKIYPDFLKMKGKIYIVDETDLENYSTFSLESKFREIDKLAQEETGEGISLVFIDHAQLLKFDQSQKDKSETTAINSYISFFRQQAVNFIKEKRPTCFIILSQTNRDGWSYASKHNGAYRLNALAEANELERASNIILSIYTNEGMMMTNQAKVKVCKSRDSSTTEEVIDTYIDPAHYLLGDFVGGVPQEQADISMTELFTVSPEEKNELDKLLINKGEGDLFSSVREEYIE